MEKNKLKELLKRIPILKITVISFRSLKDKYSITQKLRLLLAFFSDYKKYKKITENKKFSLHTADLYPRLFDNTEETRVDPVYFHQNTWCAGKIFNNKVCRPLIPEASREVFADGIRETLLEKKELCSSKSLCGHSYPLQSGRGILATSNKPTRHYDVGSEVQMIGIISQFVPTTMVDIRPLSVSLPNLSFVKGSVLSLPFADNSIESLSSICVIEHIGLGRYGDPLDQYGSEKAAQELVRVLSKGGSLYISVPIDRENVVYFNAHRAFTRDYVLELFKSLTLIEEKYVYGSLIFDKYEKEKGFGTGLFHFIK